MIRSHPPPQAGCPLGDPGPLAVLTQPDNCRLNIRMLAFDCSVKDRFWIALWLPKSITRAESISRPLQGLNCRSISILQTPKRLNTIATLAILASFLTHVASAQTCIAAVCGRCARDRK